MKRLYLPAIILSLPLMLLSSRAAEGGVKEKLHQYQSSITREQKDLRSIRRKLREQKKIIKKKQRKEKSILKQINAVERQIDETKQQYADHQKNLSLVNKRIKHLNSGIVATRADKDALKAMLAQRIRLIYREQSSGFWKILATSENLSEILLRLKFFHVLAAQNAFLIDQLHKKERTLKQQQSALLNRRAKSEELRALSLKTLSKVKRHRAEREKILNRVRHERQQHEQAVRELAAASKRLNKLIDRLESRAARLQEKISTAGKGFAALKGRLPWPTRGRVIRTFGKIKHPRFNTYIHNKGIDIAGSMGQNVLAVGEGVVLFAEWFEGYGRMIILDHGEGYNTVYAHLNELQVSAGDKVTIGQKIGQLGDSGSWEGAELYFEIRVQGKAENPIRWLKR